MTQNPLIQRALNSASLENKAKIGINPNPLNFEEYVERTPGKLELYNGFLGSRSDLKDSIELLLISLQCFGLTNIVSLLPKELWLEALNSAYPSDEK